MTICIATDYQFNFHSWYLLTLDSHFKVIEDVLM